MDHSKINQHHHSPNSHYGSTTHQLTSPTIHNSLHMNFNSNFNSHNYPSDMNPLANSVSSIFGSSVLPQPHDGILDLESGIGWCTNCSKHNDRHLPEQGTIIRSKSLDDLNSLTLQEDHHHHQHHHNHHQNHNNLQNHLNSSLVRQDHHHHQINHHHHYHHQYPQPHHHATNENGIFNQPMLSSVNCDIENVLQKISRLEM